MIRLGFTSFYIFAFAGLLHAADKPNVVIVITDDQGYGDLSCLGNSVLKTPQIDKLHARVISTDRLSCGTHLLADKIGVPDGSLDQPHGRLAHDHGTIDAT